ncbi:hypothetical protein MRX96_018050 [Rhipicephalus microplus]
MNYNRNQQRPGDVINGAQAINPQAANRNPLNHVAEAKDNTIQVNEDPPTPKENNTNSAMEVQVPVTTEANNAEPETIDVARTSEPAPKKRALEYARERRVNARLDSLEERQD